MELFIGDKIKWTIGRSLCRGIVRDTNEDFIEVVCYEINNQPTKKKIQLDLNNIKIELDED